MKKHRVVSGTVLAVLLCAAGTAAQQNTCGGAVQPRYEDSKDGLRLLLKEIMQALRANQESEAQALGKSMEVRQPKECFRLIFGKEDGDRVTKIYEKGLSKGRGADSIPNLLRNAAQDDDSKLQVQTLQDMPEAKLTKLEMAVLGSLATPATFYVASYARGEADVWRIGYFFHGGDGFRFVDDSALYNLSQAPARRIRVGGNVLGTRMVRRVPPRYPAEARQQGIQGTVRLHAIISTDGSVRELEVISGNPILVEPAIEAVRQWRYKPTYLNGVAVEVVTTIDVVFTLSD